MTNKSIKWVVLFAIMVLPIVIYLTFVYNARENFFVTLDYLMVPDSAEAESEVPYAIPPFNFTNQDGEMISDELLRGKIYVATFFFSTCPSICPAMNFHLKELQDRFLGYPDINLVSFTVDPDRDTPEVLKAYSKKIGAEADRWHFLTGEKEALYQTAAGFFISAMEDADADGGYLHSESAIIVDWEGKLRSRRDDLGNLVGAYDVLNPTALKELKEDLRVLIAEYEKFKSKKDKDEGR
jgi:protein SCO1